MTNARMFVLGVAGILLLAVGAVLVIALAPGASVPLGAPELAASPAPPSGAFPGPAPEAASTAPRSFPIVPPAAPAVDAAVWPPRPPPPPPDSWEAVRPVARLSALGPIGGAIGRELAQLQPRLSACFDEWTQARYGETAFTEVRDAQPMDDNGATVLMLEIESGDGEVRIVDAPVETRGGASDGLVACAQRVLRGHVASAPGATAGARHRALFTLQP